MIEDPVLDPLEDPSSVPFSVTGDVLRDESQPFINDPDDPGQDPNSFNIDEPESMSEGDVLTILRAERSEALSSETSGELAIEWEKAWDYYFGRARGDECEGLSQVQSLDVSDMVESLISQIMPAFATDMVVEFEARGLEDADQVRLESEYCNYVVMDQNNGFITLQEAIKSALLLKNGVLKVYPDIQYSPRTESYTNVGEMELGQMLQPTSPAEEVAIVSMTPTQQDRFDVKIRRIQETRQLKVESIPLDEFFINADHESIFMENARYVEHARLIPRSDLVAMGYDPAQVEGLPTSTINPETVSDTIRAARKQTREYDEGVETADLSTRTVFYRESYILMDYDLDGYAERRKICSVEDVILANEEVPFHPFASGTPFIVPHSWLGVSIFDKLKEIQDQKTSILRSYLDNLDLLNFARMEVVEGKANMDDLLNARRRGVVRVKSPGVLNPLPTIDTGLQSISGLEYLDQVRTDRAGASLDLQNKQAIVPTESAHGVERQISAKETMAAQLTRNLSETLIRSTFLLVHATLREYFPNDAPLPLLMRQQQQQQQQQQQPQQQPPSLAPGSWLPRTRVKITIGLSPGEKARASSAMQQIVGYQMQLMQMQSPMISPKQLHSAMVEASRIAGVEHPDRFFLDPASPEFQQAAQQQQQQQQQMQEMQQQMQQQQTQAQTDIAQAQLGKVEADREKAYLQAENDQLKAQIDASDKWSGIDAKDKDRELAKKQMDGDHAIDLMKLEVETMKQLNAEYKQNERTVSSPS